MHLGLSDSVSAITGYDMCSLVHLARSYVIQSTLSMNHRTTVSPGLEAVNHRR